MKFKLALLLLTLPFFTGCASFSMPDIARVQPPTSTQVSDSLRYLDVERLNIIRPLKIPETPKATVVTNDTGEKMVGFTPEGSVALREIVAVAETNTRVADQLLESNKALMKSHNSLVDLAKAEEERANFMATKWAEAENELSKERVGNFIEIWGYRALILIGIIFFGVPVGG